MPAFGILLVVSGVIIIAWPEIIAYMIGGLLLFFGLNIIFAKYLFNKANKTKIVNKKINFLKIRTLFICKCFIKR